MSTIAEIRVCPAEFKEKLKLPFAVLGTGPKESGLELLKRLVEKQIKVYELIGFLEPSEPDELGNIISCFFGLLPNESDDLGLAALSQRFNQPSIVVSDAHQIRVVESGSGRVLETIPGLDVETLSKAYGRRVLGKPNPLKFLGFRQFDGLFAKWGASASGLQIPLTTNEMVAVKGRWA